MKKFVLAAAALVMSTSAFANTELVICNPFSASAGAGYFTAVVTPIPTTAAVCGTPAALTVGETFVSAQIELQTDYTGGINGQANSIQTTFSGTYADVLNASGVGSSSTYSDNTGLPNDGGNFYLYVIPGINAGNYTTAMTESYSVTVNSGTVQGVSGQIYEVINYSTGAPEPGSLMLLGSGLLAAGLIGRKKLAARK